jgi:hypothetical protein
MIRRLFAFSLFLCLLGSLEGQDSNPSQPSTGSHQIPINTNKLGQPFVNADMIGPIPVKVLMLNSGKQVQRLGYLHALKDEGKNSTISLIYQIDNNWIYLANEKCLKKNIQMISEILPDNPQKSRIIWTDSLKKNVKITPTPIQIKLGKKSPYTPDRWLVEKSYSVITNHFNQLVNEQTLKLVRFQVKKNLESLPPEAATEARAIRAFLNQITDLEEKWKSLISDLNSIYGSMKFDYEFKKIHKDLIYRGQFSEVLSTRAVFLSPKSHQDKVLQEFAYSIHQNFDSVKYDPNRLFLENFIVKKIITAVNDFQKKRTECLNNIHRSYARALEIDEDEYLQFCELIAQGKFTNAHASLKKIADKISWDPILAMQAKFLSVTSLEGNATEPQSYQIYKLGLELIQLTELVPEGKQFLDCRNTIYYHAAQLCLLAAEEENSTIETFAQRHSAYAITALALLNEITQGEFTDPTGMIWEKKALAQYYTGNPQLAWDTLASTDAPRNLSIDFYLNRLKIALACQSAAVSSTSPKSKIDDKISAQVKTDLNILCDVYGYELESFVKVHPYLVTVMKNFIPDYNEIYFPKIDIQPYISSTTIIYIKAAKKVNYFTECNLVNHSRFPLPGGKMSVTFVYGLDQNTKSVTTDFKIPELMPDEKIDLCKIIWQYIDDERKYNRIFGIQVNDFQISNKKVKWNLLPAR